MFQLEQFWTDFFGTGTQRGCLLNVQVFSFLDDTALCQAAMVCRQWRMASVHEDFWKSLNFEGRKVSHDQGLEITCLMLH